MTAFVLLRPERIATCEACGTLLARAGDRILACGINSVPIPLRGGDMGGHVFALRCDCGTTIQLHQSEDIAFEHGRASVPGDFTRAVLLR